MRRLSKTHHLLTGTARGLTTAAVVIAPWLFGSAEGWAYLLLCLLIGWSLAAWLLALAITGEGDLRAPGLTLVMIAVAVFVGLQLTPLPEFLVQRLNPLAVDMKHQTRALFEALNLESMLPEDHGYLTLSVVPLATRRSLFLWIAYAGAFIVLCNTIREWRHLRRVCLLLVVSGFIMALLSMIHKFSGSQEIFWFHVPRYGGNVFGPFSNRNHFAAQMNMLLGLALGLLLSSPGLRNLAMYRDWRERLEWFSSRQASGTALSAFAFLIIAGAVFVSLSRGAMLSLMVCLAALGAGTAWRQRGNPGVTLRLGIFGVLILTALLWLGRDQTFDRLGSLEEVVRNPLEDFRAIITRDTLTTYGASPLVGWGFGAYRHVLPIFQRPNLEFRWLHAHNDWAELLADGGLVGALLVLLALRLLVRHVVTRLPHASHTARLLLVGVLFGLATITLHSLVDYSLHKPGNALLAAALAAMACAGVEVPGPSGRRRPSALVAARPPWRPPAPLIQGIALAALIGVFILNGMFWRDLRGELAFSRFTYLTRLAARTADPEAREAVAQNAATEAELVVIGGFDPDTLGDVARTLVDWALDREISRPTRAALAAQAERVAAIAILGAPSNYLPWLELARIQLLLGQWDQSEISLYRSRQLVKHPEQIRMFAPMPKPAHD